MLKLDSLNFDYGRSGFAIGDFSLEIPDVGRFGILGPNGCGKTTVLKLIGGHLRPNSGRIVFDSCDISNLPAGRRPTATIFQDHALFPHLSVSNNVSFGLRCEGYRKGEAQSLARRWLRSVGAAEYQDALPRDLSVGYQQRVAIARALALQRPILLLDEPTASLDSEARADLIGILREASEQGWVKTMVVVSHDRDFVLRICKHIAIIEKGKLVQHGAAADLYSNPARAAVAKSLDSFNVLNGEVQHSSSQAFFKVDESDIRIPLKGAEAGLPNGPVAMLLRPDSIEIGRCPSEDYAVVEALVECVLPRENSYTILATVGSQGWFRCEGIPRTVGKNVFAGKRISISFKQEACRIVPR